MTKKDYILIAEVLRVHKRRIESMAGVVIPKEDLLFELEVFESLVDDFAIELKKQNPKFDNQKFLEYINRP